MDVREELAKLGLGKIVTGLLLLAGFLIVVVWRETLYGKLAQAGEGLSKPALMAMLGLALTIIVVLAALAGYLLYDKHRTKHKFLGVFWDKEHNPFCPVCDILLHIYYVCPNPDKPKSRDETVRCPKCKAVYELLDDEGYQHALFDVKAFLAGTNPNLFD